MADTKRFPPLKSLHPYSSLNAGKLAKMERLTTDILLASLASGECCLKTQPDGTILEGHHRIHVLRQRGVDVDSLPERCHCEGAGVTRLYWLDGPWKGKLALAARPRGGDWLEDDVANWKRAGVSAVLSLLTPDEREELALQHEAREVQGQGLSFSSFPIPDLQVPRSEAKLAEALKNVTANLSAGRNVLIHCRQGIGRSGMIAACLLIESGISPGAALDSVSAARGISVPETPEQREWIERYAPVFTK